jgi:hypothetical protein
MLRHYTAIVTITSPSHRHPHQIAVTLVLAATSPSPSSRHSCRHHRHVPITLESPSHPHHVPVPIESLLPSLSRPRCICHPPSRWRIALTLTLTVMSPSHPRRPRVAAAITVMFPSCPCPHCLATCQWCIIELVMSTLGLIVHVMMRSEVDLEAPYTCKNIHVTKSDVLVFKFKWHWQCCTQALPP